MSRGAAEHLYIIYLRVTSQNVHQRAFASTRRSHDGRQLARFKFTVQVIDYRFVFCEQKI